MTPTIVIQRDGMFMNCPMPIPEIVAIVCAAITGAVQQVSENLDTSEDTSPEEASKVKDELFDIINQAFSKCLENSFPDIELRPDITAEAIKELEDNKVVNFKPRSVERSEDEQGSVIEPEVE